jgi:Domain of unknown function (DUF4157)
VHEHEQIQQSGGRPARAHERPAPSIASQIGNAGIARLVEGQGLERSGDGPARLDREIARAIDERRGRGRELDTDARANLEHTMGEDFSDVRVHDDAEAHELSKSVSAEAFTTGTDVFFRSGKYDPASSKGRELLAHELTHVSQQRGAAPTSELTVSEPGDPSEVEATSIAGRVSSAPASAAQPTATVARAAEEEEVQTSRVDRAAAPEEEEPAQA